ncbi:complement factor H-related protein 3-like [Chanos chanos]|uniref:Complement factor H-related protein 3-like n=1 Tax=Chanos chanos TaxID=29144 RepID=A0A6J2W7E1_CHACN|nr:complement factor H-related protein 3-like [Chanos chanos]
MKSNLFVVFLYVCVSVDRSSTDNVAELESNIFLQPGQSVRVICSQGSMTVENGQNSKKVLCQTNEKRYCGLPPAAESADVTDTLKDQYQDGERVKYQCQALHTISGNPYMTCSDGQWTGTIRCMKSCTVTAEEMDQNKIHLAHGPQRKIYLAHLDFISFKCNWWKSLQADSPGLRQQCIDGVMPLPRCA